MNQITLRRRILPDGAKTFELRLQIFSKDMASIAIMVVGAVLNAATFIGGNYLAKALGGDSGQAALDEKSATTRPSRPIRRLTTNTHASEPSSSTGSRRTRRFRLRTNKTFPTPTIPSSSTTRPTPANPSRPSKSPSFPISTSRARRRKRRSCFFWALGPSPWALPHLIFCEGHLKKYALSV